jgi:hypothetical protein
MDVLLAIAGMVAVQTMFVLGSIWLSLSPLREYRRFA